jgi:hypothetical protein
MVQGNIWLATIGHLQKAVETGFITGAGVLILSLFTYRWFSNKYVVAGITGSMCFIADLLVHPSHFGGRNYRSNGDGYFYCFNCFGGELYWQEAIYTWKK